MRLFKKDKHMPKKNLHPVNVPDELLPEFIAGRDELMKTTGKNFSEICRTAMIDGELFDKVQLAEYASKEKLKTIDHVYMIVRF